MVYADDIIAIIIADTVEQVGKAAGRHISMQKRILVRCLLSLNLHKCRDIIFNPFLLPRGFFRWADQGAMLPAKKLLAANSGGKANSSQID